MCRICHITMYIYIYIDSCNTSRYFRYDNLDPTWLDESPMIWEVWWFLFFCIFCGSVFSRSQRGVLQFDTSNFQDFPAALSNLLWHVTRSGLGFQDAWSHCICCQTKIIRHSYTVYVPWCFLCSLCCFTSCLSHDSYKDAKCDSDLPSLVLVAFLDVLHALHCYVEHPLAALQRRKSAWFRQKLKKQKMEMKKKKENPEGLDFDFSDL